ncbi:fluoride efflux transporter CrcB [Pseudoneobacillus sp. C159]
MTILFVAAGGFVGAILRFFISKKLNHQFPIGTFVVNISGSFLLGFFFSKGISQNMYAFCGVGFCGAFTTFSTFKLESFQLMKRGDLFKSIIYMFASYLTGILMVMFGFYFNI